MMRDPLGVRLFGYGTPYKVSIDAEGAVAAAATDAQREAENLYRALREHVGGGDPSYTDAAVR